MNFIKLTVQRDSTHKTPLSVNFDHVFKFYADDMSGGTCIETIRQAEEVVVGSEGAVPVLCTTVLEHYELVDVRVTLAKLIELNRSADIEIFEGLRKETLKFEERMK